MMTETRATIAGRETTKILRKWVLTALLAGLASACQYQSHPGAASQAEIHSIWDRNNLQAWSVGPYDANKRSSKERAEMLQRLGIKYYAYYWIPADVPKFQAEIQAMKDHNITLRGWWTPFGPDDRRLDEMLALFKKNDVHPDLWFFPPIPEYAEISKLTGGKFPANFDALPMEQRVTFYPMLSRTLKEIEARNWPKTPEEHRARVEREAARIKAIADKARPYGITVDLYSHIQWLGVPDNQADVVELLKAQGVDNIGIVYNFNHSHGPDRDDAKDFARVWKRIQRYVKTVNIAGTHMEDGTALLPGQGDNELEMMRVIQQSGWRGRVGVNAETGGDAEVTLTKAIAGLTDLAQKLHKQEINHER